MNRYQLKRRPLNGDTHLPEQVAPLLRRLYAQRGVQSGEELERGLAGLLDYRLLDGIEPAVELLAAALKSETAIMVVGDFDADGATSTALMILALRAMGARQVDYLVPNRFANGYGLSEAVVEQAARAGAQLLLTVDNGISCHAGVSAAKALGMQVIITDHHLPGETLPVADAIINPNLNDSTFPSKALAGVGVAFYLMVALRAHLRQQAWFSHSGRVEPNLAGWLDLVALGTVADLVPLDTNNRILVYQGLNRIRAGQCRPGIQALLDVANRDGSQLTASDLGFALGPRLNAAGRLDDMGQGIELILCEDKSLAREIAQDLNALNDTRREIERGMQSEALHICQQLESESRDLPHGLALYHPEWHQGVVGILAGRIKERFHRPAIAFAPAEAGILKGSGRSVQGLHMRDLLERLNTLYPDLILSFGGHAMAAGLTLYEAQFPVFQDHFSRLVSEWLDPSQLEGVIWSDGELPAQELTLATAELLRYGGPWGHGFPEPLFDGRFRLLQQRLVGERHLKMTLEPLQGGPLLQGIAFNIDTRLWPDSSVRQVELSYQLDINRFRGESNLQLLVQHLWPL